LAIFKCHRKEELLIGSWLVFSLALNILKFFVGIAFPKKIHDRKISQETPLHEKKAHRPTLKGRTYFGCFGDGLKDNDAIEQSGIASNCSNFSFCSLFIF
jgi:hypothetical protein